MAPAHPAAAIQRRRSREPVGGLGDIGIHGGGGTPRQAARAVLRANQAEEVRHKADRQRVHVANAAECAELLDRDKQSFVADRAVDAAKHKAQADLAECWREQERAKKAVPGQVDGPQAFYFTGGDSIEAARAAADKEEQERAHAKQLVQLGVSPQRRGKDDELHAYYKECPSFLRSARDHCTRRLEGSHVRLALKAKISQDFDVLETEYHRRKALERDWTAGVAAVDALAYRDDSNKAGRLANAVALRAQIAERKAQQAAERAAERAAPHGYFGPEQQPEHAAQAGAAAALESQLQVDRDRREEARAFELGQDQQLLANAREEPPDRAKELRTRRMLTRSWDTQVTLRRLREQVRRRHLGYE